MDKTTIAAMRERIGDTNWKITRKGLQFGDADRMVSDEAIVCSIQEHEDRLAAQKDRLASTVAIDCPSCATPAGQPCKLGEGGTRTGLEWIGPCWFVCAKRMLAGIGRQDLFGLYEPRTVRRLHDDLFPPTAYRAVISLNTSGTTIAVGTTALIKDRVALPYRPGRLFFSPLASAPSAIPDKWIINDITINNREQLHCDNVPPGEIPIELFSNDVCGVQPVFDDIDLAMEINIVVTRISGTSDLYGGMIGAGGVDRRIPCVVTPS